MHYNILHLHHLIIQREQNLTRVQNYVTIIFIASCKHSGDNAQVFVSSFVKQCHAIAKLNVKSVAVSGLCKKSMQRRLCWKVENVIPWWPRPQIWPAVPHRGRGLFCASLMCFLRIYFLAQKRRDVAANFPHRLYSKR